MPPNVAVAKMLSSVRGRESLSIQVTPTFMFAHVSAILLDHGVWDQAAVPQLSGTWKLMETKTFPLCWLIRSHIFLTTNFRVCFWHQTNSFLSSWEERACQPRNGLRRLGGSCLPRPSCQSSFKQGGRPPCCNAQEATSGIADLGHSRRPMPRV